MMICPRQRPVRTSTACLLAASWLCLAAGCNMVRPELLPFAKNTPDHPAVPVASARAVRVQSDILALDDTASPAITPRQLLDDVAAFETEEKTASAARLVQQYPDVAMELLRNATAEEAKNSTLQLIARAHDAQCAWGPPDTGWYAVVLDRAAAPERYREYDRARSEFLAQVTHGEPARALSLGLTSLTSDVSGPASPLLAVDAWHLTGVAHLLNDQPHEAATAFREAIRLSEGTFPYQSAQLKLLLSDALRRTGNGPAADDTWRDAVQTASNLVTARLPITDPVFWERAAYLRPVGHAWPPALTVALGRVAEAHGVRVVSSSHVVPVSSTASSMQDEQVLWSSIGIWRLRRGTPQAALVALKRAESVASQDTTRQQLQLLEAKALLALDQPTAANAILIGLANSPDPGISRAALATQGTVKLQEGHTKLGLGLLRRAVETDDTIDWPGRTDAEADLGLAYLLVGSEQVGLQWLHRAQAHFESSGDQEHLEQSLENELDYLEKMKAKDAAKAVRQRLEELQTAS